VQVLLREQSDDAAQQVMTRLQEQPREADVPGEGQRQWALATVRA
jgi:hypothetical protein